MTNKQLQNILKNYPDDCKIFIERCGMYENGEPTTVRVEYMESDNFETSQLTIEYEKNEEY